jgi:hypothetical protein
MEANMQTRPECYGGMYPDLSARRFNEVRQGKVFDVFIESSGFVVHNRTFKTKTDKWGRCTECPEYRHCFDLSIAKLTLEGALENYGRRVPFDTNRATT